jgi:hypothetical protein
MAVDHAVQGFETPAGPPMPPRRRRWGPGAVLTLVNGVLAGVGSVYATTRSITITAVAGLLALTLTAMMLFTQR